MFFHVIAKKHNGTEQSWDTGKMGRRRESECVKKGEIERQSVLMRREMGLMYERMCFQRGKGKAMAAGSDTVPVLLQCQYLLWLSSTFPPSWLMLPSQPSPASLKTGEKKKRKSTMMIHIKFLFNAVLSFSLVLALIAWNKQFWDMMAWWWN